MASVRRSGSSGGISRVKVPLFAPVPRWFPTVKKTATKAVDKAPGPRLYNDHTRRAAARRDGAPVRSTSLMEGDQSPAMSRGGGFDGSSVTKRWDPSGSGLFDR
jgi:hypothetical protein